MRSRTCDFCKDKQAVEKIIIKVARGNRASQTTLGDICENCKASLIPKLFELVGGETNEANENGNVRG